MHLIETKDVCSQDQTAIQSAVNSLLVWAWIFLIQSVHDCNATNLIEQTSGPARPACRARRRFHNNSPIARRSCPPPLPPSSIAAREISRPWIAMSRGNSNASWRPQCELNTDRDCSLCRPYRGIARAQKPCSNLKTPRSAPRSGGFFQWANWMEPGQLPLRITNRAPVITALIYLNT